MPTHSPGLKRLFVDALPARLRERLRVLAGIPSAVTPGGTLGRDHYEAVYEAHARAVPSDHAVGDGDYDLVGRLELGVLVWAGLQAKHTLVDFGCGDGRLAVHAVPWLRGGRYVGIDLSATMIERARRRVAAAVPNPPCEVIWIKNTHASLPLGPATADVICAFSVFTHMEHEDAYRYMKDARRIVRPGGRLVFSCLPMGLATSERVFLESAAEDLETRWRKVRNVTTSRDIMDVILRLADWRSVRWQSGDEAAFSPPGSSDRHPFHQSVCVAEPADPRP